MVLSWVYSAVSYQNMAALCIKYGEASVKHSADEFNRRSLACWSAAINGGLVVC